MSKIAIIGAGITGLCATYALKKKGHAVSLFEKNGIAGGVMGTIHADNHFNYLIELGPSTLQLNDIRVLNFLNEIGLAPDIIDSNANARKRYVVKNAQLHCLPYSFKSFIKTPLFSCKAKWRLLKEPFIKKGNSVESVSQFINRRLGPEILDYAVNPFVSGIYAGDPDKLSIQHAFPRLFALERDYGSLFKGMFKKKNPYKIKTRTVSFTHGMAQLPLRLAEILKESLYLNSNIKSISYLKNSWEITWCSNGKTQTEIFTKLVVTISADQLPTLPFDDLVWQELSDLKDIQYVPMGVLTQAFHKGSIKHPLDGYGMLIPSKEKYDILGTLFPSSIFPQHYSSQLHILRTFIGGCRFPNIGSLDKKAIEDLVFKELAPLLGIIENPIDSHVHVWKCAIPQYNLGYEEFFRTMENAQNRFPGLYIMGNYRSGISLPQCILAGLSAAESVN